jgi:hypothetical protein
LILDRTWGQFGDGDDSPPPVSLTSLRACLEDSLSLPGSRLGWEDQREHRRAGEPVSCDRGQPGGRFERLPRTVLAVSSSAVWAEAPSQPCTPRYRVETPA